MGMSRFLLFFFIVGCSHQTAPKEPQVHLLAELSSPSAGDDGAIEVPPRQRVVTTWKVTNQSHQVIHGLAPRAGCSCQIQQPLPKVFHPGDSAELVFHVSPPTIGDLNREIPLIDDQGVTHGNLFLKLRVEFHGQTWIHRPRQVLIYGLERRELIHPIEFQAIEKIADEPWLTEVLWLTDDLRRTVTLSQTTQPFGNDPNFCLRDYRLEFRLPECDTGVKRSKVQLNYSDDSPTESIPVEVQIKPMLVVTPTRVTMSDQNDKRYVRIDILSREDNLKVGISAFDHKLIDVQSVPSNSSRVHSFQVESVASQKFEPTLIQFATLDSEYSTSVQVVCDEKTVDVP